MTAIAANENSQQRRRGLHPAAVPVAVVLAAIVIQASPFLLEALEYNRLAVCSGQWWRLVTCHLTHWTWVHGIGDVGSFIILWWMMDWSTRRAVILVAAAASVIGLVMIMTTPDIMIYRGMSGVNYTLMGIVLTAKSGPFRNLRLCALVLVTAKVIYETIACTSSCWMPGNVIVVGVTHAAGLMVGLLAALSVLSQPESGELLEAVS